MSPTNVPLITLHDGYQIPQLGFGTWQIDDNDAAARAVSTALEVGYRHIDTAAIYKNERGVGRGIAESGIPRDELWITTKLWNNQHRKADARVGVEAALDRLGLDYLDLFLIHWPATVRYGDSYIEAWDALQDFQAEGLVRSIGVCNFLPEHLDKLNGATPVLDQVELHPTFAQLPLRDDLARRGIAVQSYSPLGTAQDLDDPVITAIADDLGKSTAQVILRWHLQQGFIVIPKTVTPVRIAENFRVFDFELSDAQMAALNGLDCGKRVNADPLTAEF